MTSRPALGVPQRQPQRNLTGGSSFSAPSSQRPPPHARSLSQQQQQQQQPQQQPQQQQQHHHLHHHHQHHHNQASFLPPSPVRKDSSLHDFSPTGLGAGDSTTTSTSSASSTSLAAASTAGDARYGLAVTQRRGGSRLRLELSPDSADPVLTLDTLHAKFAESPSRLDPAGKAFTPSRIMPFPGDMSDMSVAGDSGVESPYGISRGHQQPPPLDSEAPLPMPIRHPRQLPFLLPACKRAVPPPNLSNPSNAKKESGPKPYTMEVPPAAPRFANPPSARGDVQSKTNARAAGGANTVAARLGSISRSGGNSGAAASAASPSTHADFYPWAGEHPEDKWSETVIRNGFFDKAPVPVAQNEKASAKGTLFPLLKHKGGVHTLSAVFLGLLAQRRFTSTVTAPSTFKPPPRVTVTDTKKEIWLKDLANPAMPLRKLSRTIPHGVRGKVLLEQCLNKNVPTDRAVWLAKCVGANEIRAFKRKGPGGSFPMGGEAKWIRDWTVFVEQFVETVVAAFDDAEWKAKVQYAIRLATHLYAEHLLDREHYTEWLVSSLENSPQSRLPMWILITQIYWKDLLRLRKHGRRLVGALLGHLHMTHSHVDKDLLLPLSDKLSSCLHSLILATPENFIAPGIWSRYRDTLHSFLPSHDLEYQEAFKALDHRNEQLIASGGRSRPAARQILIGILDGTLQTPMPDELPAQCWAVSQDKAALMTAVLEWCASPYRSGLAKVYVTSCLLQHWSREMGADVTNAVLGFMDSGTLTSLGHKRALYQLVGDLIRSHHFSVSRYFQWLISRGGLTTEQEASPGGDVGTRLLVELPTHMLTPSQKNTRAGMLRRASYSVDDETHDIELAVKCLTHTLGLPLDPADPMARRKPLSIHQICKRIALSSQALKTEIGSWLRDTYASIISRQEHYLKEAPGVSRIPDINSPNLFHAVRAALEAAQDYGMLADLLTSLAKVASDAELLASVGDTVNRHLPLFGALGAGTAARNLFDNLYCRLRVIVEEQGIGARPLLASLVSLAPRFPGNDQLAAQLRHDLLLSDRNHPVDACSPVSDITGSGRLLQSDDAGDVQEEMEKLLTSGTSLDRNTMEKLFRMVIQRLQTSWWSTTGEDGANANEKQRTYCVLLARLRAYDMQAFDLLLGQWVLFLRSYPARPPLSQIFPLFASVGCLNMAAILKTASLESVPGPGSSWPAQLCQLVQQTVRTRYLQEVLHLILTPVSPTTLEGLLTHEECYRFSILQDQAQRECARELLGLVRAALVEYSLARRKQQEGEDDGSKSLPLDWPGTQDHLLSVLRLLVLKDAAGVARVLAASRGGAVGNSSAAEDPDVGMAGWVDALTTRLLMPDLEPGPGMRAAQHDEQQPMPPVTFDRLLGLTDDFTLPFCQVKLSLMMSGLGQNSNISPVIGPSQSDGQSQQKQQQQYFDLFARAVDAAINAGNVSWTGMLSSMSPELTQHLKTRAQARFLSLVPSPSGQTLVQRDHVATTSIPLGPGDEISTAQRQKLNTAQNLLAVINAINNGSGIQSTAASTHPPVAPPTSMQGVSSAGIGRPQQHPPQLNNQQPHVSSPQPQLSSALADKLVDTWELLVELAVNGSDESTGTTARQKHRQKTVLLVHWIPLLLTFVTMHLSHGGAGAITYAGDSNSGSSLAGSKPFSGVPGVGAHNANDETRARALVACAGLLQELEAVAISPLSERDLKDEGGIPPHEQEDSDMMDTTDDFQHSEQEYTATRTGTEDGDDVTSLAKTDVDVRTLTNRMFDIACLLADNLTEDARLACARALMLVRDNNPQSHVTSSPTVASGPTGVLTICDARLRYLVSVSPPSALGDNTMLSHRDKSILPGQGNSASGGQQGKVAGFVPGAAAMGATNLQSPAMPLPLTPGGNVPSGSMNSYFSSGGHVSTMPTSSANGGDNNNGSSNNSASAPTSAPAPTGNNNAAAASLAPSFPASHIYIGLNVAGLVPLGSSLGWIGPAAPADARLAPFHVRRWEMLNDPTPNVGENDTALNLGLFEARKVG